MVVHAFAEPHSVRDRALGVILVNKYSPFPKFNAFYDSCRDHAVAYLLVRVR